jgi:hypothetical protein
MAEKWPNFVEMCSSHKNLDYLQNYTCLSTDVLKFLATNLPQKCLKKSFSEKIMCAGDLFRQRPNFSVDLAEIIFQKLATLLYHEPIFTESGDSIRKKVFL